MPVTTHEARPSSPPARGAQPLSSWQRRIVMVAWITYAAYYLGRVNISTAMPGMQVDLALTKSQVGLLSTSFFWGYGIGQLINAQLGDRLSPRRFIFVGMLASAALNFLFGASSTWLLLLVLWTINGYFQATGWGPVLRTLANWLDADQRRRVSGMFGSCFVAGNAITWLLTGWLVARFNWRIAFWGPALLLVVVAVVWYSVVRDTPVEAGMAPVAESTEPEHALPVGASLLAGLRRSLTRFWPLVIAAICLGFCLAALMIWMPTYYVEVGGIDIATSATLSTLIPVAGIVGTLSIGWVVGKFLLDREAQALALLLLLLAGLFVLHQALPVNLVLISITLMVIGAVIYGATSLILSTLPLTLSQRSEASSTAGLIDFSFNLGAGVSGWGVGAILDSGTWSAVFLSLAAASLFSALFVLLSFIRHR